MQVNCDWSMVGTAAKLEAELQGFVFRGPGLYLTATDTILVVSASPEENPWSCPNSQGKLWRAHVYNAPYSETILSHRDIPCR